jgi:O-antigen ligase
MLIFTGLIISFIAIRQYFFGFNNTLQYLIRNNLDSPFMLDYIGRKRVFTPFITPNTLAGYLIMIIPLAITNKKRIWLIAPLFLALFLTKSLGGLFSIFLGLILYYYLLKKLDKKNVIIAMTVLLISIALIFIIRSITPKQHAQPLFSTMMRLNYWKDTLAIIKASPLVGVGLGNFNLIQSRYAHNSFLQIWTEMGILGIMSFVWLLFAIFKSAASSIKITLNKNQLAAFISAGIAFLIHNTLDFSFFLPEVVLIWWMILGLSYKTD